MLRKTNQNTKEFANITGTKSILKQLDTFAAIMNQ
jgi:hypothetical protein